MSNITESSESSLEISIMSLNLITLENKDKYYKNDPNTHESFNILLYVF